MRIDSTDDVTIALHDLGGEGPSVLVAHATGFCAGAYRPLTTPLAQEHRVWALDFRAHGDSTRPEPERLGWSGMIDDVEAVVAAIGAETGEASLLGFGHSMGGACLLGAELRRPGTFRAIYAYEPITIPASWGEGTGPNPLADSARRRRGRFASRSEALARYASRPPLGSFRADALWNYVEHGFAEVPGGNGEVELKCPPEHEAAVFQAPGKPRIDDLGAISIPVVVALGERDASPGPADFAPDVAAALPNGELHRFAHLSHFGPFQDPDTLAADAEAHFAGR